MYRLSDDLAKLLLQKMKTPKVHTDGERKDLFTPVDYNGLGIIDPVAAICTELNYSLECPYPILYPDLPYIKNPVDGFYLYRRIELMQPLEQWPIIRALIDPTAKNYEETIDVSDCSIILPSAIDKLTISVGNHLNTLEELIAKEPAILDCLNLDKK